MSAAIRPSMSMTSQAPRGVSLTEILIASMLAGIVLVALGRVDLVRYQMADSSNADLGPQSEARYALAHIVKELQQADRINLVSPTSVQLRIPPITGVPSDFDLAAKYRWDQYWLSGGTINFASPSAGCAPTLRFLNIGTLTIAYDPTAPPPGGNLVQVTVTATNPRTGQVFTYAGQATLRAGSYTGLTTGLTTQTGAGFDPPAVCS